MALSVAEEKKSIELPNGKRYVCKTDDLKAELIAAAASLGWGDFVAYIDGNEITEFSQLQTNSISAVIAPMRIAQYTVPG